jgi:Putative polyhydroxyalkanoic acid system protein (PHA_gran_rgn)
MKAMSKPLVVTIPHRLGQQEAITRLKTGLSATEAKFGQFISVQEQTWTDNRMLFRLSALAQSVSGSIDIYDDFVRLEIVLPGLLAAIAETIQPLIRKEGTLLLEKK